MGSCYVSAYSLKDVLGDTNEYAWDPSPIVLQYVINSDLNVLSSWFD